MRGRQPSGLGFPLAQGGRGGRARDQAHGGPGIRLGVRRVAALRLRRTSRGEDHVDEER